MVKNRKIFGSSVDVIMVSWNAQESIEAAISSNINNESVGKIIIVDNNSSDRTIEIISQFSSPKIVLIQSSVNLGFGKACNLGSTYATASHLLFLNPDTVLNENAIIVALEQMAMTEAEVVGIKMIDENGVTQRSCARFPTLPSIITEGIGVNRLFPGMLKGYFMSEWSHDENRFVDHVIGAFYLMKREKFIEVGGFDPDFFLYYEDLDLSKRIRNSGGRIYYTVLAQGMHEGGGTSKSIKAKRTYYAMSSRTKYAFKHLGYLQGGIYLLSLLTLEFAARNLYFMLKGDRQSVRETNLAYRMYFDELNSRIRRRLRL